MGDAKFGLWTVPESPVSIEYSLVVIEEIRHEVAEGYQRLSRGGIEVGGILYGTHDGPVVRVLAIRPISCEHAHGPAFQLSANDRTALDEQLTREQMDPRLAGMIAVGWFLSHTRTEISLTESDLKIYSNFFPAPWQVALVVHPGRGGSMRAGFFVREENGALNGERSYLEFDFPDRLAGVLDRYGDRTPRERGPGGMRRPLNQRAESVAADPAPRESSVRRQAAPAQMIHEPMAQEQMAPEAAGGAQPFPLVPLSRAPARSGRRWALLTVWVVLALVAAVFGFRYWMMQPTATEPISLSVIEREGQLQVEWNHSARPVTTAIRGSLEIVDGSDTRTLALMPQDLDAGKFTYARKTGDVEIRLTVENAKGRKVQEASRFLGRPPATTPPTEDLTALEQRRAELETEVTNLRQGNNAQAARIQQLERTLRILQTRLGIDQGK